MAALTFRGGSLIFANGGLTTNEDCCCDPPPPPECPDCCVRIDWGAFDESGWYLEGNVTVEPDAGFEMYVKIKVPNRNSRIVCDDETIELEFGVSEEGEEFTFGGVWVRHGVGWKSAASVGGYGKLYPNGLVDWGFDFSDTDFSVAFTMQKCFMDSSDNLYYITINADYPTGLKFDIPIERCLTVDRCCDVEIECDDCCKVLKDPHLWYELEDLIRVQDTVDANGGRWTSIMTAHLEDGYKVCVGGGVRVDVELIPPRHPASPMAHTFRIEHGGWRVQDITPPTGVSEDYIDTTWEDHTEMEFSISLSLDGCDGPPELGPCFANLEIGAITGIDTLWGFVGDIDWEECGELSVETCCPPPCSGVTGLFPTGIPGGIAEDENEETCATDANWTLDGEDGAFIIGRNGTVMEFGCLHGLWISGNCSSYIEPGGPDGAEITFTTEFNIASHVCLNRIKIVGHYSADNYVKEGEWKINGVDQGHIRHGSYSDSIHNECIEFEITAEQGEFVHGVNTVAITVKNGSHLAPGGEGWQMGLNLVWTCVEIRDDEED